MQAARRCGPGHAGTRTAAGYRCPSRRLPLDVKGRRWPGGAASPGRSVTSRALAILDAFDAGQPAAVPVRDRRALGHAADDRAPAARRADRLGRPGPPPGRPLRDRPQAVGPGPARPGAARAAPGRRARSSRRAHHHPRHRAPRRPRRARPRSTSSGSPAASRCRWSAQVGSRLPLHATGVGKVLLAAAPAGGRRAGGAALADPDHPHTVVEPGRLRRELAEVRRRGYARTSEEMSPGAASLAVPVQVERAQWRRSWWPRSASSSRRTAATSRGSCRCSRWPPAASAASWPAPRDFH